MHTHIFDRYCAVYRAYRKVCTVCMYRFYAYCESQQKRWCGHTPQSYTCAWVYLSVREHVKEFIKLHTDVQVCCTAEETQQFSGNTLFYSNTLKHDQKNCVARCWIVSSTHISEILALDIHTHEKYCCNFFPRSACG